MRRLKRRDWRKSKNCELSIVVDREADGRWLAEVVDLPGIIVYGGSRHQAVSKAQVIALRAVADLIEDAHADNPIQSPGRTFGLSFAER